MSNASKLSTVDFGLTGVSAGFSLRDTAEPGNYTMRRAQGSIARANINDFARVAGFDVTHLVLPAEWPYGNRVPTLDSSIKLVQADNFDGLRPTLPPDQFGPADACDGLVTQNTELVLGVQNADCPMIFLFDPATSTIGVLHSGWRPLVRGVIVSAIKQFIALGSEPATIRAYVGPGVGDDYNDFQDAPDTRPTFAEYHREYLLDPARGFLRPFTPEAKGRFYELNGQPTQPFSDTVLAISAIARQDLLDAKLVDAHITVDTRSSVLDHTLHSRRRDGLRSAANSPHGLSLGFIHLTATI